jgi:hypothetical protein
LTSSTSVVVAPGHAASTPQGVRHRRLQLWWWSLLEIPAAPLGGLPSTSFSTSVAAATGHVDSTPQGASHRCLPKLGTCCQNFSSDTYQGATAVNITTTSKAASRKSEGNSFIKIIFGSCVAKYLGFILPLQKFMSKSTNYRTALIIEITKR